MSHFCRTISSVKKKGGFTLIELLIILGIVAALFIVILIAVDPARRFAEARNATRQQDTRSIEEAVLLYSTDNKVLPTGIDVTLRMLGTATSSCGIICGGGDSASFFIDDTSAEFSAGTFSNTQYDSGNNWVELTPAGQIAGSGTYSSSIKDALSIVPWNTLSWLPQAPYGKELPNLLGAEVGYPQGNASMTNNVVLLHLNELSGVAIADSSGEGNPGTAAGGVGLGASGKLRTALNFDGINDRVVIANSTDINSAGPYTNRTIALWFNADTTTGRHVLYEEGAGVRGFNIYIDSGNVYVGGWNTAEYGWAGTWLSTAIATSTWYNVALRLKDGTAAVVADKFKGFLNGVEFGSGSGGQLFTHPGDVNIGRSNGASIYHNGASSAAFYYDGRMDEFSMWNRGLAPTEILDVYKRGVLRLKYQVRSCDDLACVGESFIGPDGGGSTFYTEASSTSLTIPAFPLTNVINNRYFQYQATLETDTSSLTPELTSVTINGELTSPSCLDLSPALVPDYLASIPQDPLTGNSQRTFYAIKQTSGERIYVNACSSELGQEIISQR